MKKRIRKQRRISAVKYSRYFLAAILVLALGCSVLDYVSEIKAAGGEQSIQLHNPGIGEVQGGVLDTASGLQNPRVTMKFRDSFTFGSYWQEDTNNDGQADKNDEKQPIRWQVLSVNGDDVFLMADKILDCQPYHELNSDCTWETASLRRWLNEDFYNEAFTEEEKRAIKETVVVNEDNETEGGNETKDKVYLMSISEAINVEYGFVLAERPISYYDQARLADITPYAEKKNQRGAI